MLFQDLKLRWMVGKVFQTSYSREEGFRGLAEKYNDSNLQEGRYCKPIKLLSLSLTSDLWANCGWANVQHHPAYRISVCFLGRDSSVSAIHATHLLEKLRGAKAGTSSLSRLGQGLWSFTAWGYMVPRATTPLLTNLYLPAAKQDKCLRKKRTKLN